MIPECTTCSALWKKLYNATKIRKTKLNSKRCYRRKTSAGESRLNRKSVTLKLEGEIRLEISYLSSFKIKWRATK